MTELDKKYLRESLKALIAQKKEIARRIREVKGKLAGKTDTMPVREPKPNDASKGSVYQRKLTFSKLNGFKCYAHAVSAMGLEEFNEKFKASGI